MPVNYIALAIPFFFLAIGIELWVARRRGKGGYYRFNDAITDLSCGIGQQVTGIFGKAALIAGYVYVFEHWAPFRPFEGHPTMTWVVAFAGVDLAYYWWHRLSHRVAIIWATHVVHHQSQEYNLAVALRQSMTSSASSFFFYLPLAFIGLPIVPFVTANMFNILYQFWIHTRLVGKLGPIELVFNTPSHHRVHHGINPKYIDRNYAGILIIWDRLFGTFQEEEEEPVYGTVKPFTSWNSLWANVEYFLALARQTAAAPHLSDKLKLWIMPPGWIPRGLRAEDGAEFAPIPEVDAAAFVKWDTPVERGPWLWVLAQFVLVLLLATALLFFESRWPLWVSAGISAFILATLASWAGVFEKKRWTLPLDVARFTGLAALLALWAS